MSSPTVPQMKTRYTSRAIDILHTYACNISKPLNKQEIVEIEQHRGLAQAREIQ